MFPNKVVCCVPTLPLPPTSGTDFALSTSHNICGERIYLAVIQSLLFFSLACKVPSVGPVTEADNIGVKTVTVTWKEIPKSQRNGFISNYTIFYQAEDGKEFCKCACSQVGKPPSPREILWIHLP